MSQIVGQTYKSRIPTFGDDASIEEALRVYHYGVDNYTTQTIPDDSIEGNFRGLNTRVTTVESSISTFSADFLRRVSLSASPNIITAQSTSTTPLVVRAIASQTSSLQQWQNSSNAAVASISTGGTLSISGYASIGSMSPVSTTALNLVISSPSHKGLSIRSSSSQTGNLQEWQDSSGTAISWVDSAGEIFINGQNLRDINYGFDDFLLMGA